MGNKSSNRVTIRIVVTELNPDCLNNNFGFYPTSFWSNKIVIGFDKYKISESSESKVFNLPIDVDDPKLKELGIFGSNLIKEISKIEGLFQLEIRQDGLIIRRNRKISEDKLKSLIKKTIQKVNCQHCDKKENEK